MKISHIYRCIIVYKNLNAFLCTNMIQIYNKNEN